MDTLANSEDLISSGFALFSNVKGLFRVGNTTRGPFKWTTCLGKFLQG